MGAGRKFTADEDQYLRDSYLLVPSKRMSKNLNRSEGTARQRMKVLGLVIPADVIELFKKRSHFKKGAKSHNKGRPQHEYMSPEAIEKTICTRFKQGQLPHNTRADRVVTIRNNKGVLSKWIRIGLGKWQQLHHYNWKKGGNELEKGFVLAFKDFDPLNCETSNLIPLTRAQNLERNRTRINHIENMHKGWRKRKDKAFANELKRQETNTTRERTKQADKIRKQLLADAEKRKQEAIKALQRKETAKHKEKERITKEKLAERKMILKPLDLSDKIPLRIDSRTVIYIRPDQDADAIKNKYLNRTTNF
jgi:hypothetical protein